MATSSPGRFSLALGKAPWGRDCEGWKYFRRMIFARASMTQEMLSSLALMHIHYPTDINPEEIVDLFAKKYPRRLELGTLLKDHDDHHLIILLIIIF